MGGKIPEAPKTTTTLRTLRKGMKGDDVARMQKVLGVTADGDFGFGTQTAVKKWQNNNGLTADGIVGPATQSKMFD
jgi:peptidoglycan hydrolase-like protein with peptidoglycan-binding domain